jgi:hypothetical protein
VRARMDESRSQRRMIRAERSPGRAAPLTEADFRGTGEHGIFCTLGIASDIAILSLSLSLSLSHRRDRRSGERAPTDVRPFT